MERAGSGYGGYIVEEVGVAFEAIETDDIPEVRPLTPAIFKDALYLNTFGGQPSSLNRTHFNREQIMSAQPALIFDEVGDMCLEEDMARPVGYAPP